MKFLDLNQKTSEENCLDFIKELMPFFKINSFDEINENQAIATNASFTNSNAIYGNSSFIDYQIQNNAQSEDSSNLKPKKDTITQLDSISLNDLTKVYI